MGARATLTTIAILALAGPAATLTPTAAPITGGSGHALPTSAGSEYGPPGPGADLPAEPDEPVLFRDVRLFDGRDVHRSRDVLVRGDTIAAVGPGVDAPEGATVIEGGGRTLLPGLIDAHVHTLDPGSLRQATVLGVTTELDMFTTPRLARRMEREQRRGEAGDRADLFASGHLATAPGGHGTEYGVEVPTIDGPGEAAGWVDDRVEAGADYIKIVYDDGSVAGASFPTLSLETVRRLIEAAHDRDRLAVVHVSSLEAARQVVRAGADVLAHVWMDSVPADSTVEMMAKSGVALTPTLSVIRSAAGEPAGRTLAEDPRLRPYLASRTVVNLEGSFPGGDGAREDRIRYPAARRSVERTAEAGVPVLAGTDAPNPGTAHGPSLHGELELLVEAGLSPVEALRAATSVPARVYGLEERGRIEPGRRADLLLVEGDPTADVADTRSVVGVWKGGRRIDRDEFREEVDAARRERAGRTDPAAASSGLVSDFEGEGPEARFGSGWQVSTDRMMGGTSEASMQVVEGGAAGSSGALEVSGEITDEARFTWAGALFVAGASMQRGANLSDWDALSFRARGEDGTHTLMVFSESLGARPATTTFRAGEDWRRHRIPFDDLRGVDGSGLIGVLFSGRGTGSFRFRIDDVRFVRDADDGDADDGDAGDVGG